MAEDTRRTEVSAAEMTKVRVEVAAFRVERSSQSHRSLHCSLIKLPKVICLIGSRAIDRFRVSSLPAK